MTKLTETLPKSNAKNERKNEKKNAKNTKKNAIRILRIFGGNNNTHQSKWSKMKHIFICRVFLVIFVNLFHTRFLYRFDSHSIKLIWFEILALLLWLTISCCALSFWIVFSLANNTTVYNLLLRWFCCCLRFFLSSFFSFHLWFRWNSNTESYKSIQNSWNNQFRGQRWKLPVPDSEWEKKNHVDKV